MIKRPLIFQGDGRDAAQSFLDGTVALMLFSTPYPNQRGFKVSPGEYIGEFLPSVIRPWRRKLTGAGVVAQVVTFPRDGGWWDTRQLLIPQVYARFGLRCVNVYIWDKLNSPPSGNHERHDHPGYEFVFVFAAGPDFTANRQRAPYAEKTVGKAEAGNMRQADVAGSLAGGHSELHWAGALQDNVLRISSSGDQGRPRAYGGSFPRELARRIILTFSNPGDMLVDPFCGAGTSCVVGMEHGRVCYGYDLRQDEVDKANAWVDEVLAGGIQVPLL